MQVKGTIEIIKDTEVVGAKDFRKRTTVIKEDGQYPQLIPIEFVQDKVTNLDDFKVGQKVIVSINLRGSEWDGKHYLSAQGWRIELDPSQPQPNQAPEF